MLFPTIIVIWIFSKLCTVESTLMARAVTIKQHNLLTTDQFLFLGTILKGWRSSRAYRLPKRREKSRSFATKQRSFNNCTATFSLDGGTRRLTGTTIGAVTRRDQYLPPVTIWCIGSDWPPKAWTRFVKNARWPITMVVTTLAVVRGRYRTAAYKISIFGNLFAVTQGLRHCCH